MSAQIPFDDENELHRKLVDLKFRFNYEEQLAGSIRKKDKSILPENHLIIDIPSKISFEVDLPILGSDNNIPFIHSGSVFSQPVVQGFTDALRHIRIIVPEETAKAFPEIPLR